MSQIFVHWSLNQLFYSLKIFSFMNFSNFVALATKSNHLLLGGMISLMKIFAFSAYSSVQVAIHREMISVVNP